VRLTEVTHRNELPFLLRSRGVESIVEVGNGNGTHLKQLAQAEPRLLVSVDVWLGECGSTEDTLRMLKFWASQQPFEVLFCEMTSVTAALRFAREGRQFDFVYIDADHNYQPVYDDLRAWWPRVKPGGIFAGHDYRTPEHYSSANTYRGLRRAIDEWEAEVGLPIHKGLACSSWMLEKPDERPHKS